ncbi:heat repeat-containing protein, partial [Cystoisospora suis]
PGGYEAVDVFASEEYRQFFCRFSDPSYVKSTKLQILSTLATERNCMELIGELREYVCDPDPEIGKKSILVLGVIACKIPLATENIITLGW